MDENNENMKYNFDKITVRKNSNCVKWDAKPPVTPKGELLPMWVADMDFEAAPFIKEAIIKRAEHGVFGYTSVPDSYYDAVCDWFRRRYDWHFSQSDIIYTTGVVPGISAIIKAITSPEDKVLIQTPVYNSFFSSIVNDGCQICESQLKYCNKDGEGHYCMDFEDLDRKCADEKVKVLLLCNPHNPAGKIWTKEELAKTGEICRKHNVIVVSDEIHCELVRPGRKYTPFAAASEENAYSCISLNSPSKSFNIAGLQTANIVCKNEELRNKVIKALNANEVHNVNPFGPVALIAAYGAPEPKGFEGKYKTPGEEWLEQLNEYIEENYLLLKERVEKELPDFILTAMEGTYLAWIDCKILKDMTSMDIEKSLIENESVWINAGSMYGMDGFIRINMACPKSVFKEGVERIIHGLKRLQESNI